MGRYIVRERLRMNRAHNLETVGFYVQDRKTGAKVSPCHKTVDRADHTAASLEAKIKHA